MLDPFAGGGAIPLEAMRLGCEATAIDINPVAWFILKCTLEYPQKLAGQKRPLPDFALRDREFMEAFFTAQGFRKLQVRTFLTALGLIDQLQEPPLTGLGGYQIEESFLQADLAWHVRAWGRRVLADARKHLAPFYPIYADFEPVSDTGRARERQPMRLVPLRDDGSLDIDVLNREFAGRPSPNAPGREWLADPTCPRWVAKPTVAYLWARTVRCKNCRATIPLLKTRWLTRKATKRVLLTLEPNGDRTGVEFGIQADVPVARGNNAVRREHDRKLGVGTMTRAGAWCPCCGKRGTVAMEMEAIRAEGVAGRMGAVMTAVVADTPDGRAYRLPTPDEIERARAATDELAKAFALVPSGLPDEPLPSKEALGFRVPLYGLDRWHKLFTPRQLLALATFLTTIREARPTMRSEGYPQDWCEALIAYLAMGLDRLADRSSGLCRPDPSPAQSGVMHTFARFALPMNWDFIEGVTIAPSSGGFSGAMEWVAKVAEQFQHYQDLPAPNVLRASAVQKVHGEYDAVITDPPYYDAIPYSDLMDFFYVWLRRILRGHSGDSDEAFHEPLGPKWDVDARRWRADRRR